MTDKQVRERVRAVGMVARKVGETEWRVSYPQGCEASAYYTDDKEDAVATAEHMSKVLDHAQTETTAACLRSKA